MLKPVRLGSNMAAGNQQKHQKNCVLLKERVNLSLEELKNIKTILFLTQQLLR